MVWGQCPVTVGLYDFKGHFQFWWLYDSLWCVWPLYWHSTSPYFPLGDFFSPIPRHLVWYPRVCRHATKRKSPGPLPSDQAHALPGQEQRFSFVIRTECGERCKPHRSGAPVLLRAQALPAWPCPWERRSFPDSRRAKRRTCRWGAGRWWPVRGADSQLTRGGTPRRRVSGRA